jgi:hypothetical protein
VTHRAVCLTAAQAETLRRAASKPDIDSGAWDPVRDVLLYEPLVRDGLLTREIRPAPGQPMHEIVHYETTEAGKWALGVYDRQRAGGAP